MDTAMLYSLDLGVGTSSYISVVDIFIASLMTHILKKLFGRYPPGDCDTTLGVL